MSSSSASLTSVLRVMGMPYKPCRTTPIEVAYLHDGQAALDTAGPKLKAELSELVITNNPTVEEGAKKLVEAREAQNQIVSWLPEIMVMGDAPTPRPTYVLSRGLYNQHLEEVSPRPLTQIFPFDDKLPKNRIGLTKWLFDPKNPLIRCGKLRAYRDCDL